jgi:hypothetical protein
MHWPEPVPEREPARDRGPVLVTVEYRIDEADAAEFLRALHAFSAARRRDGAYAWGVFEDVERPGRFLEYFLSHSWLEHLRQHRRVTRADQALQERVRALHRGADRPRVTHYLAAGQGAARTDLPPAGLR